MKSGRQYYSVSSLFCSSWPGLGVPRAEIAQKSSNLRTCDLSDTKYRIDLNSYLSGEKKKENIFLPAPFFLGVNK